MMITKFLVTIIASANIGLIPAYSYLCGVKKGLALRFS